MSMQLFNRIAKPAFASSFTRLPITNSLFFSTTTTTASATATATAATETPKRPTLRSKKAFLTLTDRAAERIMELMQARKNLEASALKIGVRRRGCSGLTYTMNYCSNVTENKFDEIVQDKGVTIVIDNKALMALVGTEMDWVEDDLRAEFVFNNPNSKGTCGCGESFHI